MSAGRTKPPFRTPPRPTPAPGLAAAGLPADGAAWGWYDSTWPNGAARRSIAASAPPLPHSTAPPNYGPQPPCRGAQITEGRPFTGVWKTPKAWTAPETKRP
jgi:hypothetical protein